MVEGEINTCDMYCNRIKVAEAVLIKPPRELVPRSIAIAKAIREINDYYILLHFMLLAIEDKELQQLARIDVEKEEDEKAIETKHKSLVHDMGIDTGLAARLWRTDEIHRNLPELKKIAQSLQKDD